MEPNIDYQDELKGMLVGLAIGDMIGAPLEFYSPNEFEPITEPIGGGKFNLPKGYWTDDTSMALCLADSLLTYGGYNSFDVMNRYWLWRNKGYRSSTGSCFDVGGQVDEAMAKYIEKGGIISSTTYRTRDAGNGCIMRLAPVIIAAYKKRKPEDIIKMAKISARETHYSEEAELATEVFAALLLKAIKYTDKSKVVVSPRMNRFRRFFAHDGDLIINGKPRPAFSYGNIYDKVMAATDYNRADLKNTGYIIHSLQIAVWAFHNYESFREGALAVANLGGDADTNTAVYGQLAGAFWGYKGIPHKWRKLLYKEREISQLADKLIALPACPVLLTRFEEDYKIPG